jgi:uncharacterized membrane protein YsdA (DUF1294 family)
MNKAFRRYGLISIIVTVVGYLVVAWLVDWPLYFVAVTALSATTFLLYGLDKFEAARPGSGRRQRVPENLLHLLALLGGFPGGWLGRFVFWHKIRKSSFWLVLVVSTIIHIPLMIMVW